MIRDRRRISNKLQRIEEHIRHRVGFREPSDYNAINEVQQLSFNARTQPLWKWEGFESEVAWAHHQIKGSEK